MADNSFSRAGIGGADRITFDAGLRAHMQRVFNYMGGGLALTGLIAFLAASTPLAFFIYGTAFRWVAMLAPLVMLIWMQVKMNNMTAAQVQTKFWIFCGLMGLSMGAIFLVYTHASVARAFFITGATFGAMSLYGYTTKRDLTGVGSFLFMGMLGLMIASVVNIFLMSSMLQWMVSIAGVAIFTGLTAYQVQAIKQTYAESAGVEANDKLAVWSALTLYLSFINLFQFILSLTGNSRN